MRDRSCSKVKPNTNKKETAPSLEVVLVVLGTWTITYTDTDTDTVHEQDLGASLESSTVDPSEVPELVCHQCRDERKANASRRV